MAFLIIRFCSSSFLQTIGSVFLLGSLGIGKRCFGSRNNSTNSNPFASGLLLSREISKVSFELPEGFSVTAENGSSKVCFELLKMFRVTPENLAAGLPLRSRATCSNLAVFLVYSLYFLTLTMRHPTRLYPEQRLPTMV